MIQGEQEHISLLSVAGHVLPVFDLRVALRAWGAQNGRSFPWRTAGSTFHLLIAEMMLRRTQARQVIPVYAAFSLRFPDAQALASAPADEVAAALYSLGLAWRVPAFQKLAHALVDHYGGIVPTSYAALVDLPGVGDYVAAAICCFAFVKPVIIADTNTVRVTGRLFGIPTHAESRRRKPIRDLLDLLLDRAHPRSYNYALLDLAALICTPIDPKCPDCPLLSFCKTGQEHVTCPSG